LQYQAKELRKVTSGGVPTKVVAVGIGKPKKINQCKTVLKFIASDPDDDNVIYYDDVDSMDAVAARLVVATC